MLSELWFDETEDDTEEDELDEPDELDERLELLEDGRLALELLTTDCELELTSVDKPLVDDVADPETFVCEAEVA